MLGVQARFIISASNPGLFPPEKGGLPEVAFLGRSNVGKSSLLNALVGQEKLAHTSSTPGRTQGINFYRVDERMYFVDLPGYGFAKVSHKQREAWKQLIDEYLLRRENLKLSLLLIDARRGFMEADLQLKEWLEHYGRPYLVVATKTDKLKSQKEQQNGMAAIRKVFGSEPLAFSARTGRGVREIWQAISTIHNR
jgi:GTP-binding protein